MDRLRHNIEVIISIVQKQNFHTKENIKLH